MTSVDRFERIADLVTYGLCPLIVVVDLSYKGAKEEFKRVFELCENWWKGLHNIPWSQLLAELPGKTTRIFNLIYGDRHVSMMCIRRSIVSSLIAILLMSFVLNSIDVGGLGHTNAFVMSWQAADYAADHLHAPTVLVFALIVLANLIVDYAALLETRIVLSWIRAESAGRTLFLVLVDYAFNTLTWVFAFWGLLKIGSWLSGGPIIPTPHSIQNPIDALFFPFRVLAEWKTNHSLVPESHVPVGHIIGVFSGATYFTSLIFYAFAFVSLAIKAFRPLLDRLEGLLRWYATERSPRPLVVLSLITGAAAKLAVAIVKLSK